MQMVNYGIEKILWATCWEKNPKKNKKTQTRLKNKGCLKSCGEGIWWDEAC